MMTLGPGGRIIAVANQKGGVGKTTVTINLGAALAEAGARVLAIDLDPQGHLTRGLGMKDADPPKTLAVALRDGLTVDLAVQRSECFDVVPTSVDLFYAERLLNTLPGRELRLRRVIEKLAPGYQYVLIDCPPTLGYLTDNALVAAGWVLVPLKAQDSSVESANMLLGQVSVLRETLGVPIEVLGLVVNELDDTNLSKTILDAIPEELPEHPVLASIRRRVRIAEAWRAGKPITELEPWGDAADAFRTLAQAVVDRCDEIARVHTHA